jgi:hypothetical protein
LKASHLISGLIRNRHLGEGGVLARGACFILILGVVVGVYALFSLRGGGKGNASILRTIRAAYSNNFFLFEEAWCGKLIK